MATMIELNVICFWGPVFHIHSRDAFNDGFLEMYLHSIFMRTTEIFI